MPLAAFIAEVMESRFLQLKHKLGPTPAPGHPLNHPGLC
jgi:hypothetical protein